MSACPDVFTCGGTVSIADVGEDLAVFQCDVGGVWSDISRISKSCVEGHLWFPC